MLCLVYFKLNQTHIYDKGKKCVFMCVYVYLCIYVLFPKWMGNIITMMAHNTFPHKVNTFTAIQWPMLNIDRFYTTQRESVMLVKWEGLFHYFDLLNVKPHRTCVNGFPSRSHTVKYLNPIFLNGMLSNLFLTNSNMTEE